MGVGLSKFMRNGNKHTPNDRSHIPVCADRLPGASQAGVSVLWLDIRVLYSLTQVPTDGTLVLVSFEPVVADPICHIC